MAQLLDRPHAAVRAALAAGAPLFIPVNPVEFHGPHLSLHNDHLLAVGLAERLHAALWPEHPCLITRDLELGVDPCPGPGTRLSRFPEVRRAVLDAA
ncbi:MAG: creatininase family protein, partial [Myxococcales bacterium]|nr:creatininase family protein [Myxococcales bacterium]